MSASIAVICDPSFGTLTEAVRQAKSLAHSSPGFDVDVSRFLQMQCCSPQIELPLIFRGLEVLEAITDEGKLLTLLRPFLKSSDPQIASKCVLVLGRRCHSVGWMKNVMAEVDDRIRANLIESLWRRTEPEIELVLQSAIRDPHHRVAANATYGLFLLKCERYMEGLDHLISSPNSLCRRSAIWLIGMTAVPATVARLKTLIRDRDPAVRHAAFQALVVLRQASASMKTEAETPHLHSEPAPEATMLSSMR